jgi:MFS family permease
MLTTVTTLVGRAARPFSRARYEPLAYERTRFNAIAGIALFKLFNFFGSAWDIQWHASIGRDNLFIPPHMVAAGGFVGALGLSLAAIAYETWLDRQGAHLPGSRRFGGIMVAPVFLAVALSFLAAIFFTFLDDQWHRLYGLDSRLWSPPHLLIGAAMAGVDFSLLLGLAACARRLGWKLNWRSPYFWAFCLAGAFAFEAVSYWTSEAFIVAFAGGGAGLLGLLWPMLMGALYALGLVLSVRLAGRYWIVLPILAVALVLQYTGTGLSAVGFKILNPVSEMEQFVRENPDSTVALVRQFAIQSGYTGLIGMQQAWVMWLSAIPLVLVAALDLWPAARRRMLAAAPVYSLGLVLFTAIWFRRTPVLADYAIGALDVLAATLIVVAGSLVLGWVGLRLAERTAPAPETA